MALPCHTLTACFTVVTCVQLRTPSIPTARLLFGMVESNHDEERLARIEQMIERLQRESAINKVLTGKLVVAVAALTTKIVPARRKP